MASVTPVIMCGGAGTRLWPASRAARPKQLLRLAGEHSLLQTTLERVAPGEDGLFGAAVVITGEAYAAETRAQLAHLDPEPQLVLEPFGRNTAVCAAVASAMLAAAGQPDGLILLAASDHHMPDPAPFRAAVDAAREAAADGRLVAFGIRPTRPETGYGYILKGAPLGAVFEGAGFVEKPDLATAQRYLADGRYFWNAGYFLFRADVMLEEMRRLAPEIALAGEAAVRAGEQRGGALHLDAGALADCPSISIDYAVMEKAEAIALAPVDAEWSDLGSWAAIWDAAPKDGAGNAVEGDALLIGSSGCFVRSDGPVVTVVGGLDLVVIAEGGAVLVVPRARAQEVKAAVEALRAAGREDLL